MPDAISFANQEDVAVSSVQTSNTVVISGLTVKAAISIENGEYSLNCDATSASFTSSASVVNNGAQICVRHTSSENTNTETTTSLTVGSSTVDFVSKTVIDRTPDVMSFNNLVDAALATEQKSEEVTVTGIDVPVEISITGGEYSKGCEENSFTAESGMIAENESFCVRHVSSADFESTVTTTVTVGDSTTDFSSTTLEADSMPDSISFAAATNVAVSTVQTSEVITVTGINLPVEISITSGEYALNCDENSFTTGSGMISENETFCVRHTSSASFSTTVTTTVNVGDTSASFSSTTQADPNPPSENNNSSSGGAVFWLLPLALLGLRRKVSISN